MVILLYLPLVDQYKGQLFDYRIEPKIKVGGIKKNEAVKVASQRTLLPDNAKAWLLFLI